MTLCQKYDGRLVLPGSRSVSDDAIGCILLTDWGVCLNGDIGRGEHVWPAGRFARRLCMFGCLSPFVESIIQKTTWRETSHTVTRG